MNTVAAGWPIRGGAGSFTASTLPPASPVPGDRWLDLNSNIQYTWYADETSSAWVELASPGVGPIGQTGATGSTGATGPTGPKSLSLRSPTATEKVVMFWTTQALTVSRISSVLIGSSVPSVTFSVRHGTDVSAAGTEVVTSGITVTNTTTGLATTSFNNASIAADRWVWLTTSAASGVVDLLHVTLNF